MNVILDRAAPLLANERDIETALERVAGLGYPMLMTRLLPLPVLPDPISFLAASSQRLGNGLLWLQESSGIAFAGAGVAAAIDASGSRRFQDVSAAIRSLRQRVIGHEPGVAFPVLGGFAFDAERTGGAPWGGYPDARFNVPSMLLQAIAGQVHLRLTLQIEPGNSLVNVASDFRDMAEQGLAWIDAAGHDEHQPEVVRRTSEPCRQAWEASVAAAVAMIHDSALDKVVLAREERLQANGPISVAATLERLRRANPTATVFAMQSDDDWFVGASPERLVRLNNGRVDVTCLAGSIATSDDPDEREALGRALLASGKDREEHEIVVRSTMAALQEVCAEVVRLAGTPRVVTARSVQHLESPLVGYLTGAGTVLDLVERLHPTPAVGGYPRADAFAAIRNLEQIDRGWYAGPFGWVDPSGSGEFIVAIRSGLISGYRASLFAGCGIVEDSVPAAEFAETELKFKPMLSALQAS